MSFKNLDHFLEYIRNEFSNDIAFSKLKKDEFEEVTYEMFVSLSYKCARLLKAQDFKKGSKVVYLSKHDVSWPIYAFGIFLAGGTLIPIDMLLSQEEISSLISESDPDLLMVNRDVLASVSDTDLNKYEVLYTDLDELIEIVDQRHIKLEPISNDDLAFIIYTSGTTGNAKGVMIHFGAIISQLNSMKLLFTGSLVKRSLSVLPINHMYEFTVGLCTQMMFGVEIVIANSLERDHILLCLHRKKIHKIVGVPLLLKSFKDSVYREIESKKFLEKIFIKTIFFFAKYINCKRKKKILFKKIHNKFGGELIQFAVGGAKCAPDVKNFFNLIGLSVYEGYGLTETSPIIATNAPTAERQGSVGKVLHHLSVKIKDTNADGIGQIIVKGESVFRGYYKNPVETQRSLADGWFHTGDLGKIDNEGYLYITGRIKNLIVLEGGKKIYPEEIESKISEVDGVTEAFLCALEKNGKTEVVAAIIPVFEESELYGEDALLKKVLDQYKKIAHYKRPTQTIILKKDLPRTSSRKIKINEARVVIEKLLNV